MLNSIKSKLIIWFLSVFSILFLGLGTFLYYELKDIAIGSIDSHLHSETQLIAGLIEVEHDKVELELKGAAAGEYASPFSGHYYQIVSDNNIVIKSPSLVDKSLPFATEETSEVLTTLGPKGEHLRLMNQPVQLPTGIVMIQAAEPLEDIYRLLLSFRNIIMVIFPIFFILSGIGITIITGISLKTLDTLSEKVSTITEKNLNERVEEKTVDKELKLLATSFNNMMIRIEDAFLKQRQFLSDASHELRTPTSVIKSYCDVTLKKERSKNEYEEALTVIRDASERITSLIQKILDISRLESKNILLKNEVVDIGQILNNAYKLMHPLANEKGIEISLLDGKEMNIYGDKERLTELFINLLDNAIKYNKKNGTVALSSGAKDGFIFITVSDTGIGIPEEHINKIFDRFYRIDESRGTVLGAGLGLSIVKAIVDAHGGKIAVKSKAGEGSEFKIMFPAIRKED